MNDPNIDLSRRRPQYLMLAQSLIRDIEAGRYPISSLLPTEAQLSEQFGMSRHTVREAIRRLQEAGLVTRQQGVGTRVKNKSAASRYVHRVGSISDLFQYAREVKLKVTATAEVVADKRLAESLCCRPGQRWLKLDGLRYAKNNRDPICFTEVYISYEFASIREHIGEAQLPIYQLIESHYAERIKEVQQQIRGLAIPARLSRMLRVRASAPGLSITRHYLSERDRIVEVSFNTYPADRFSYSMRLSLDVVRE